MTTALKESKTVSAKADKRDKVVQELRQLQLLGDLVCWTLRENRGVVNSYQSIIDALKSSGLDEKYAKEFLPAQAFNRACSKLREERVIDVLRYDKDEVLFQFSKRQVKDDMVEGGQEFLYQKEVKILLEKSTGNLTCKDLNVLEQAKKELTRCMEARTTSDVSNIVNKLFDDHTDLIPVGVGVYFVPQEHSSFADKISKFLAALGRKIQRFPVPAGTQRGDQSVTEAMESYFESLMNNLMEAVRGFSLVTRSGTIEGTAEKINSYRAKIEAYAVYLQDRKEHLLEIVDHADKLLMVKIEALDEERKTAPPSQGGSMRQKVFACVNGTPKTVHELCEEAGVNTNGIKTYLDKLCDDDKMMRKGNGYCLPPASV